MQPKPLACGALRLGNVFRRHFAGDLLAMEGRLAIAADGSEVEPFVGGDEILLDIAANRIEHAEIEELLGAGSHLGHGHNS